MKKCPRCGSEARQHKIGFTKAGSQRYKCQACGCRYTPEPKHHGYSEETRRQAVKMYVDGINFRRIGRMLGVHHTSVMNWVNVYAGSVAEAPVPDSVETAEMDEVYTYVGSKKTASTS
jgi:transposase-like protein